ncbi:class III extradiol dioxygenase subunit B-like domain-containing protein [Plantactinospora sp. GCM10030261]|uniref:class III extradiol dioxygenase subunit B-like domain-containing protein n=1 Tax=Plantactinospora sp. GCM10030261 TaxID=3273420 RepID=UPI003622125C
MPLVAAAVCPHPPLIVPEVAGDAAPELNGLRGACDDALVALLAAGPDEIILVGGGPETTGFGAGASGTLWPYGVPLAISLGTTPGGGPSSGGPDLPLSLTIGAWLLNRTGTNLPRHAEAVTVDAPSSTCLRLGERLADRAGRRTALLVLGDGTARRDERAPGYHDPRALAYDEEVARALADADTEALLGMDPGVSAELTVAGRAAWQVLAGAVRSTPGAWRGELRHHSAPYGVGYLVANWEPIR